MRGLNKKPSLLTDLLLSLVVMMLWGSLFPMIKIGYRVFDIHTDRTADILMFAAMRFVFCGAAVCLMARFSKAAASKPRGKNLRRICVMGIFAIVLHYGFTYVGLTMTESSKTAILKQIAPLLFACFSFLFVKGERFSVTKTIGAVVGFLGLLVINGASFGTFSTGDLLIVLASVCSVAAMVISGKCAKETSPLWITGISQLFGGTVLLLISSAMGGKISAVTPQSLLVFLYLCTASIAGYTLFYHVQRTMELSKLLIVKFAEPLFACVFSAVLLKEDVFNLPYLLAFLLISSGIVIGNLPTAQKRA